MVNSLGMFGTSLATHASAVLKKPRTKSGNLRFQCWITEEFAYTARARVVFSAQIAAEPFAGAWNFKLGAALPAMGGVSFFGHTFSNFSGGCPCPCPRTQRYVVPVAQALVP
ncbi:hypothetical protein MHPYR_530047 [uncultured Mycobacterium sp.]|uniref:Uncharacterized protein n=1 Tax=uncultured Mycobacterium sp. TaxID=171292 RepID=A0A1Y5PLI2_9MYCO|nr:hypothetical protein MHPYR_530047 [uncultured Mycobacterium sp.]